MELQMKLVKNVIKTALASRGYGILKLEPLKKREIYNAYYMGECFKCIKGDPLTEDILLGRGWDNQIPDILSTLKAGKVIEIGANIGTSILPHVKNCPDLEFLLYEPVPVFYELLQENHKTYNKTGNTKIEQAAFGAIKDEIIEINIGLGTAGKTSLVHYQMKDDTLKIRTQTVDDTFKSVAIALMKIDVDGHELGVLKGSYKTLQEQHPQLFLEFAPRVMQDIAQSPMEMTSYLKDLGYDCIKIWDHDAQYIKTTSDWNELIKLGLDTPHYLNILVSKRN